MAREHQVAVLQLSRHIQEETSGVLYTGMCRSARQGMVFVFPVLAGYAISRDYVAIVKRLLPARLICFA